MTPQLAAELLEIVEALYDGSESMSELGRKFGRASSILKRLAGDMSSDMDLQYTDYLEITSEDALP